jgi:NADH dehydrogenase (ubiquinone) Fe-S protein 8
MLRSEWNAYEWSINLYLYTHLYNYTIMSRPISLFSSSLRASSSLRRPISALPRAPVRFLATPTTGPQTVSSGPIKTPHPLDASTKTNNDEGSRHVGEQQPGSAAAVKATQAWPDYSKGPSALDKASQLFFFTEIVRGKFCCYRRCQLWK